MNSLTGPEKKIILLGLGAIATTISVFATWFLFKSFKPKQKDKKDESSNEKGTITSQTQLSQPSNLEKQIHTEASHTASNTEPNATTVIPVISIDDNEGQGLSPISHTTSLSHQITTSDNSVDSESSPPPQVVEETIMSSVLAPNYCSQPNPAAESVDVEEDIMLSRVVQQCSQETESRTPELIVLDSSDEDFIVNDDFNPNIEERVTIVKDLEQQMPKAQSTSISLVSIEDRYNGYDADGTSDGSHNPLDDTVSIHSSDLSSVTTEDTTTTHLEVVSEIIRRSQAQPLDATVFDSSLEKLHLGRPEMIDKSFDTNGVGDDDVSLTVDGSTDKLLDDYVASLESSLKLTDDKSSTDISLPISVTDSGISVANTFVSTCVTTSQPLSARSEHLNSTTTVSSGLTTEDKSTISLNEETVTSVDTGTDGGDTRDVHFVRSGDSESTSTSELSLSESQQNGHPSGDDQLAESTSQSSSSGTHRAGNPPMRHVFLLPLDVVGPFIGRAGRHINALKKSTQTEIQVSRECPVSGFNYCIIEGETVTVNKALRLIANEYPGVNLTNVEQSPRVPQGMRAAKTVQAGMPPYVGLVLNVAVQARVCNVVSAGHVFVQLVAHQTFNGFQKLEKLINTEYGDGSHVPLVPDNVERGVMCVAATSAGWVRAHILSNESEHSECEVKLLDHGGYRKLPRHALRQIRQDFIQHPFQAVEVYIDEITPLNQEYFTDESTKAAESLVDGKYVTVCATAFAENQIPYVKMGVLQPNGKCQSLSEMLIDQGLVAWYNPAPQLHSPSIADVPTTAISEPKV